MTVLGADTITVLRALQVKYDWNLIFSQNAISKTPKKVQYAPENDYASASDHEDASDNDWSILGDEDSAGDSWLVNDESNQSTSFDNEEMGIYHDVQLAPPSKSRAVKNGFARKREKLAAEYYKCYNDVVFDGQLPADLKIIWNKRMLTTAGYAKMPRTITPRTATIELSVKVNDTEERLRETLLHEMCHVAAWVVNAVTKPPHGATFRKWADRAESKTHMHISTCHSYDIHKPHRFKCCNETCGKKYTRHTKRSINIETQLCGVCHSSLAYEGVFLADGTPKKSRELNAFSSFVKDHYSTMKQEKKLTCHGDVMKALSSLYATMRVDADIDGRR